MKKYFVLFLTLLLSSVSLADKVTEQEALQKAQKFFKDKRIISRNLSRGSKAKQQPSATPEDYYVFNVEDNGGFVIITGDDRTPEVLGYADSGNIDMDNLPPNLKGWLEEYSKQIKALETSGNLRRAESRAATRTSRKAIEPLITTKWGQDGPYNLMCPEIDGQHCVTGCVATAMAQVMYYHKWPQDACAAIPEYTTGTRQMQMDALPPTTFKWDKMRDRYWEGEHGESADAVAELMRYCGQAVTMDYNVDESGSGVMPRHLIQYFGYSKNAKYVTMAQYTMSQWEDILYNELNEGRPMLYSGGDAVGYAHEFICDGYDGEGYYHFNWGWDGSFNGYFLLSVLLSEGICGGYVSGQDAIIGLQPGNGEVTIPYVYGYHGEDLTKTEYTRPSVSDEFSEISLMEGIFIQYEISEEQDISIDYGLGLYKGTQLLTVLNQSSTILNSNNNTVNKQTNVAFGRNLEDGVYQIRSIYKYAGNDNWEACTDSYINYIVATISDCNLTLKQVSSIGTENATYIVNNVNLIGNEVIVNLTNTGNTNQELLFLWTKHEEELVLVASCCGAIGPGETGDVVFPSKGILGSGSESGIITASHNDFRVMWEGLIYCPERLVEQSLTCSDISIINCSNGVLRDSEARITLTITNTGNNSFNDGIVCEIYKWNNGGAKIGIKTTPVLLNIGETKKVEFVIPHLEDKGVYQLYFEYYYEGISFLKDNVSISFLVAKNSVESNGIIYSYSPYTKTASVIPGEYQKLESVAIPPTIMIEGVPYSVTEIAPNTFKGCLLQSVSLPEGLLSIGSSAFEACDIKTINFPSTLKSIEGNAFMGTTGLKDIYIPEGVIYIGYAAFWGCRDLEVLKFPSTLGSIGEDVLFDCFNLKSVYSAMTDPINVAENIFASYYDEGRPIPSSATLYVPKGSVAKYQAASGWNIFSRITDKHPYKLIYYVDGEIYKEYVIEEETSITPEAGPTKEGYTFSGWSEIPETMPSKDVTITGSFSVNKYNLIYKVDDNDYKSYNVEYGSTITPEESPTKDGYAFSGWSEIPETMPNHDVEVNGRFYIPGDANGDGVVNIADIVEIVNFINNKPSDNFDELAANVTSDDKINDDDIAAILNIIMK